MHPAIRRIGILVAVVALLICGIVFGGGRLIIFRAERAQEKWKEEALVRLANPAKATVDEEIAQMRNPTNTANRGWIHEHTMLMINGEYIVYDYRHAGGGAKHLLLGRCSDGRWLYGTYHFCGKMAMIASDPPPGSIAEFMARYPVREFSGSATQELARTWSSPLH